MSGLCMISIHEALSIGNGEEMVFALQDEIRRNSEARYDHRLHAVLLVAQGMSCRQTAEVLGDAPRTVESGSIASIRMGSEG